MTTNTTQEDKCRFGHECTSSCGKDRECPCQADHCCALTQGCEGGEHCDDHYVTTSSQGWEAKYKDAAMLGKEVADDAVVIPLNSALFLTGLLLSKVEARARVEERTKIFEVFCRYELKDRVTFDLLQPLKEEIIATLSNHKNEGGEDLNRETKKSL